MVASPSSMAGSPHLAASGSNLAALKASARQDPKGAIREVAKQFEALFMQELMKSMRASTMSSGLLDNQASEMATGMLDQQYASQMTGLPGGLADAIARQLEGRSGAAAALPEGWRQLPAGVAVAAGAGPAFWRPFGERHRSSRTVHLNFVHGQHCADGIGRELGPWVGGGQPVHRSAPCQRAGGGRRKWHPRRVHAGAGRP